MRGVVGTGVGRAGVCEARWCCRQLVKKRSTASVASVAVVCSRRTCPHKQVSESARAEADAGRRVSVVQGTGLQMKNGR